VLSRHSMPSVRAKHGSRKQSNCTASMLTLSCPSCRQGLISERDAYWPLHEDDERISVGFNHGGRLMSHGLYLDWRLLVTRTGIHDHLATSDYIHNIYIAYFVMSVSIDASDLTIMCARTVKSERLPCWCHIGCCYLLLVCQFFFSWSENKTFSWPQLDL
jgi:hypothetical protein